MKTAAKIKMYRKLKGLTQKELAARSNMLEETVRKYELGIRHPKPDQLIKLAIALEISPIMLFDMKHEGLKIETVADALALFALIREQIDMSFIPEKDDAGNPIPHSVLIRINDAAITRNLSDYMKATELLETATKAMEDGLPPELDELQNAYMEANKIMASQIKAKSLDSQILVRKNY